MASVDRRPFFLGGDGGWPKGVYLLQKEGDCDIVKWRDGRVELTIWRGPWTNRHTALAREFQVNQVTLDNGSFRNHQAANFLLDLPRLRVVSILLYSAKDLSALGRLTELRRLYIDLATWRIGDQMQDVDFSGLRKLEFANVMMCRAFESLLACSTIQQLGIHNTCDGRLRDLDLTRMPRLRDLLLDHCPKLRRVRLHAKARVRGLELSLCGSYKIDWPRFGPDLRYLSLGGRLTFPLRDIVNAPKLEELHTTEIRKLPPLGFLRKLRHLRTVFIFTAPPGPKLSHTDKLLIREINARGKRKAH